MVDQGFSDSRRFHVCGYKMANFYQSLPKWFKASYIETSKRSSYIMNGHAQSVSSEIEHDCTISRVFKVEPEQWWTSIFEENKTSVVQEKTKAAHGAFVTMSSVGFQTNNIE